MIDMHTGQSVAELSLALTEGRLNPGYQTNYKFPDGLLCSVLHMGIFSTPVGVV